jgi:hypothetical protein
MRRALILATVALAGCSIGNSSDGGGAPSSSAKAAEKLGFPAVATRNTVRVGGGDAVADLAGTVTAVFPATSADTRPHAVVLVDKND